jgi:hypothetical protein
MTAAALKLSLRAALVSLALVAAVARPGGAQAATPCWKALLNDWYDGRIDQTYERHCYTDALHHLPADVSTYSSAHDDITRALQSAIAAQTKKTGKKPGPNALLPPEKPKPGTKTVSTPRGKPADKGLTSLADKLNPGSATALPLPLLILGGLALILVAAGAAGLIAKRLQGRRPPAA